MNISDFHVTYSIPSAGAHAANTASATARARSALRDTNVDTTKISGYAVEEQRKKPHQLAEHVLTSVALVLSMW